MPRKPVKSVPEPVLETPPIASSVTETLIPDEKDTTPIPEAPAPVLPDAFLQVKADLLEQVGLPVHCIRVRDLDGHLLFIYNAETRNVEIKARGRVFAVSVDVLKNTAARNWIATNPVSVVDAKELEQLAG
jgi:hypothetical protein